MRPLDADARAVIAAGRIVPRPGPEARARVREALAARLGAGGGAGAPPAPSGAPQAGPRSANPPPGRAAAWGGGAVRAAAVLAGVGIAWLGLRGPERMSVSSARLADRTSSMDVAPGAPGVASAAAAEAVTAPMRVAEDAGAQAAALPPAPAASVARTLPGGRSSARSADVDGDSLAEELAMLREARRATRDGDGSSALATIDALAKRHPRGVLAEERAAARVLALCAAGDVDAARREATLFLRQHPASPQADRVRASCARDGDHDHGPRRRKEAGPANREDLPDTRTP